MLQYIIILCLPRWWRHFLDFVLHDEYINQIFSLLENERYSLYGAIFHITYFLAAGVVLLWKLLNRSNDGKSEKPTRLTQLRFLAELSSPPAHTSRVEERFHKLDPINTPPGALKYGGKCGAAPYKYARCP